MAEPWLIVGLGNPGPHYASTRHNIGQVVVDELAARRGARLSSHRANAQVAEAWLRPGAAKLILAKPNTFMNLSGGPVANLARFFKIPAERTLVLHDELDIPFDTIRLKAGGGHGGHNGLRDIQKALGTPDFNRVRIGVGRPVGRQDPADWVLSPFGAAERDLLGPLVQDAADAAESLVEDGLVAAQQRWHAPRG